MPSELLVRAIANARQGNRAEARRLLESAIKQDPSDEHAWIWLANVSDSEDEKRFNLAKALSINPASQPAQDAMRRLGVAPPTDPAAAPSGQKPRFALQALIITLVVLTSLNILIVVSHSFSGLRPGQGASTLVAKGPGQLGATSASTPDKLATAVAQRQVKTEVATTAPGTPSPAESATAADEDIKQLARNDLSYYSLVTDPEASAGQPVYYRGQVVQVSEDQGQQSCVIALASSAPGVFTQEYVWVNYEGPAVAAQSIVNVWGRVKGVREYVTTQNTKVNIPEIDAIIVEVE